MDFDVLLDSALAAIDAAKPRIQATKREILTFVFDDYIAGFSTRKDGITYVLVTSWFNGENWEEAKGNMDWIMFFQGWIGIPFMSKYVKFREGEVDRHRSEIREVFPQGTVSFCVLSLGYMIWIDPRAPEGMDNAIECFAPAYVPYNRVMRNQVTGMGKTLSVASFSSVEDVKPFED